MDAQFFLEENVRKILAATTPEQVLGLSTTATLDDVSKGFCTLIVLLANRPGTLPCVTKVHQAHLALLHRFSAFRRGDTIKMLGNIANGQDPYEKLGLDKGHSLHAIRRTFIVSSSTLYCDNLPDALATIEHAFAQVTLVAVVYNIKNAKNERAMLSVDRNASFSIIRQSFFEHSLLLQSFKEDFLLVQSCYDKIQVAYKSIEHGYLKRDLAIITTIVDAVNTSEDDNQALFLHKHAFVTWEYVRSTRDRLLDLLAPYTSTIPSAVEAYDKIRRIGFGEPTAPTSCDDRIRVLPDEAVVAWLMVLNNMDSAHLGCRLPIVSNLIDRVQAGRRVHPLDDPLDDWEDVQALF